MIDNSTPKGILKSSILSTLGLMLFGLGVYISIQANIGVSAWDIFHLGLSKSLGILYGTASIIVSLTIVVIDILMKEKIGISMILDSIVVGKTVDLLNYLDIIPLQSNIFLGIGMLLVALVIEGFAQYLYIKAGLGAGPRDSLLVGLHRRFNKVPIGVVSIVMLVTPAVIGYFLGGPLGIGTVIFALCSGPIMQFVFKLVNFVPTEVMHQSIFESMKIIFGANTKDNMEVK